MGRRTTRHRSQRHTPIGIAEEVATLAVEEPLELRIGGEAHVVTMRTPGDDMDLVAGYLVSTGAIWQREHLTELRYCTSVSGRDTQDYNTLSATLSSELPVPVPARSTLMTSACGVCGVESVESVRTLSHFPPAVVEPMVSGELLRELPATLRRSQVLFAKTGGVHAAGLFNSDGRLLCLREDVGRHNAVDKVVGWALREGLLPLRDTALQVSGRASFELVQKAAMAGIPLLSAVSAPSSLAVNLAAETGITLAGFSRGDRVTVYTHPERVR